MENDRIIGHEGLGSSQEDDGGPKGGGPAFDDHRDATKRLAKLGQWQTPPLPAMFAAATARNYADAASAAAGTTTASIIALPTSADEYARMLQDAYKRGAEAGARVAQRPPPPTTTTAAGPMTTEVEAAAASSVVVVGGGGGGGGGGMMTPTPAPAVQPTANEVAATGAVASAMTAGGGGAQQQTTTDMQIGGTNYGNLSFFPPAAVAVPSPTTPPTAGGEFVPNNSAPPPTTTSSTSFAHSKSMPDMSSYRATLLNQGNDEEDKRKKRLARNRASARLRRLKKKNLVDSYEGEVGILESALSKLKSHQWGSDIVDHEVLIEALSMERGQQPLTPEGRRELVQSILNQQRCVCCMQVK